MGRIEGHRCLVQSPQSNDHCSDGLPTDGEVSGGILKSNYSSKDAHNVVDAEAENSDN
jgi:hypothetical protein